MLPPPPLLGGKVGRDLMERFFLPDFDGLLLGASMVHVWPGSAWLGQSRGAPFFVRVLIFGGSIFGGQKVQYKLQTLTQARELLISFNQSRHENYTINPNVGAGPASVANRWWRSMGTITGSDLKELFVWAIVRCGLGQGQNRDRWCVEMHGATCSILSLGRIIGGSGSF